MYILVIICVTSLATSARTTSLEDAKKYLKKYGYIGDDSLTDFQTAIMEFQERYNLVVDGQLNDETMALMDRPRCIVGENNFVARSKWNKTHLIWYFPQAHETFRNLTKKAFSFWEDNSNLKFTFVLKPFPIKPDITITVQKREHWFRANCQGRYKCPNLFDGPGVILAHAYFPEGDKCREIHLDSEEKWYYGEEGVVPEGQSSFLMTLVHEIGHSLGLGHSDVPSAVMYPWYQENIRTLSSDDIMALEHLYGVTQKSIMSATITSPSYTTPTENIHKPSVSTAPSSTTTQPADTLIKNLCEVTHPDIMFLGYAPQFPNHRLYVIFQNLLWKLDVRSKKIPDKPEDLRRYLPKELPRVTHMFQDISGNLFVANQNRFYLVSFPSLNIQQDIQLNLPQDSMINIVFQTNTGQSFIWYNNESFIEFNMNDYQVLNRGRIKDMFPGVPEDISSVFRYMDGHLYFMKENTYYKYNEFRREVVEAGPFNWNILGISCPNKGLLEQLKSVLTKIINLYE